ncbi:MAG: hypothetical protein M1812_004324 [Candelaria pacifica]|nr:MAG: hypothetical protein M1812_004324 [Candelaria pacifica]
MDIKTDEINAFYAPILVSLEENVKLWQTIANNPNNPDPGIGREAVRHNFKLWAKTEKMQEWRVEIFRREVMGTDVEKEMKEYEKSVKSMNFWVDREKRIREKCEKVMAGREVDDDSNEEFEEQNNQECDAVEEAARDWFSTPPCEWNGWRPGWKSKL